MKESPLRLSLLDYLAYRTGCLYVSDLHRLGQAGCEKLARVLESLAPEDAPLQEWNDALAYLTAEPPAQDARTARQKLLSALAGRT